MRMKRRDQKGISASKLIGMRMKRDKIRPIMIVIDIFLFFLIQKYQIICSTCVKELRASPTSIKFNENKTSPNTVFESFEAKEIGTQKKINFVLAANKHNSHLREDLKSFLPMP